MIFSCLPAGAQENAQEAFAAAEERRDSTTGTLQASVEVFWIEPLDRKGSGEEIPEQWVQLADDLHGDTVVSVVIVRGSLRTTRNSSQPFVLWAASSDAVFQGEERCWDSWGAVELFVGSSEPTGWGAPWGDTSAELELCRSSHGARVVFEGEPDAGDVHKWGELSFQGWADLRRTQRMALEPAGTIPEMLLPAIMWPRIWEFEKGEKAPPGYAYHERRRYEMALLGMGVFTLAYALPLIVSYANEGRAGPWGVPVAGPFLGYARFREQTRCGPDDICEGNLGDLLVPLGAAVLTIGQVGGLGVALVAPFLKKRWYERESRLSTGSWDLRPMAVRSGSGVEFQVVF